MSDKDGIQVILTESLLRQLYLVEGLSDPIIALKYNTSVYVIGRLRELYGISAISKRDRLKLKGCLSLNDLTEEVLRKEYCENLLSMDEIATKYHTRDENIISMVRKFSIPIILNKKFLRRSNISFTKEQKQIIYGSLCGDASIVPDPSGSCLFTVSHSLKQEEYLTWKATTLRNLLSHSSLFRPDSSTIPGYDKIYKGGIITTFVAPIFNELRTLFYPNGKKVISRQVLNELSELGLAVWFMDDGSNCSPGYDICGVWTDVEKIDIESWFREHWNIDMYIKTTRMKDSGTSVNDIVFNSKPAKQLQEIIKPHIIPSMRYKLG